MRIEKMNDQQIRCTLTGDDLKARKINLSELAYGTDKARSLFREVMVQASVELDFEADNLPLMIEAVPINSECIVLTVTKVEDPEELDTRFSQFSPALIDDEAPEESDEYDELISSIPEELKGIFNTVSKENIDIPLVRLFSFSQLGDVMRFASIVRAEYDADNTLYKDSRSGRYLLALTNNGTDMLIFNRICNIASEYGESESSVQATQAYLEEHCEILIDNEAIQRLSQI